MFKSYDLGYLRGIISMMRPEHRGATDIPREMRYTEPRMPPTVLTKETKDLFLYTEGDYICHAIYSSAGSLSSEISGLIGDQ